MAAVGAGRDDAFVFREARPDDVEEAAEGNAEEPGEDCTDPSDQLEFVVDCGFAPVVIR